jgi:hypothetical protein
MKMDEYIRKDKAIDIFIEGDGDNEFTEGYNFAVNEYREKIKAMPAADVQPVNQWISVKDRLPDENQKCLVYRDINADLKITTGIWHSDMKEFYGLRHGTRLEDTIAWQPLPEPPEDGEQNDT